MPNKTTKTPQYKDLDDLAASNYRIGRLLAYQDFLKKYRRSGDLGPNAALGYNEAWDAAERAFYGPLDSQQ